MYATKIAIDEFSNKFILLNLDSLDINKNIFFFSSRYYDFNIDR